MASSRLAGNPLRSRWPDDAVSASIAPRGSSYGNACVTTIDAT